MNKKFLSNDREMWENQLETTSNDIFVLFAAPRAKIGVVCTKTSLKFGDNAKI